jgi:hypothetical protein
MMDRVMKKLSTVSAFAALFAAAALTILGRMAALPHDVVQQQLMRGEREPIIAAAFTAG